MKSHRILLATLLASTLALITPNVGAQAGTTLEDFESYTPPETPDGSGVNGAYTHSINGGGSSITTTAQAHDGNQSMRLEGSTFNYGLNNLGESFCGVSWWVFFTAFPTTAPYWMGITDAAQATPFNPASNSDEWAAFSITTTGVVQRQFDSNDAGAAGAAANFGLTLSLSTWYNFVIDCSPAGESGTLLFYETTTDTVVQIGAQTFDDHLDLMSFAGDPAGTSAGAYTVYVDDIALPFTPPTPDVIFCAEPLLGASADWGYDYKENTTFDEEITGIGTDLQDGFILDGDSGDSAYLGKAFTPGTTGLRQVARVEAGSEGGTSVVRLAYTTGAVTLSDGSTGDTGVDLTTAGNGQETGNFEDNIQAVLIENGDQWSVSIRYSLGGSSLAVIDGSANYGANPNTPHTFSFVVNTGSSTITGPIVDSENHTLFDSGFSIAPGKAQLYGEEGRIIERTIPSGLATSEWKDSWIIAKGDTVLEALTYIDDNTDAEQADDSTCIFDLIGTAVRVGQAGSTPGSFISQPPPDTGGSGGLFDPANIDSALFIGFLLVAGMIFTGARQGIVGMGLVGVFLLGLGLGFALGWIPLWLVLVMFVVSLAAVWFLPKPSGDGVS